MSVGPEFYQEGVGFNYNSPYIQDMVRRGMLPPPPGGLEAYTPTVELSKVDENGVEDESSKTTCKLYSHVPEPVLPPLEVLQQMSAGNRKFSALEDFTDEDMNDMREEENRLKETVVLKSESSQDDLNKFASNGIFKMDLPDESSQSAPDATVTNRPQSVSPPTVQQQATTQPYNYNLYRNNNRVDMDMVLAYNQYRVSKNPLLASVLPVPMPDPEEQAINDYAYKILTIPGYHQYCTQMYIQQAQQIQNQRIQNIIDYGNPYGPNAPQYGNQYSGMNYYQQQQALAAQQQAQQQQGYQQQQMYQQQQPYYYQQQPMNYGYNYGYFPQRQMDYHDRLVMESGLLTGATDKIIIGGAGLPGFPGYTPPRQQFRSPADIQRAYNNEVKRQQKAIQEKCDIIKKISRAVHNSIGDITGDELEEFLDEQYTVKFDGVDDEVFKEVYEELKLRNKLLRLKPVIADTSWLETAYKIQKAYKDEFPDNMSMVEFFDRAGSLYRDSLIYLGNKRKKNGKAKYDSNKFKEILQRELGDPQYFRSALFSGNRDKDGNRIILDEHYGLSAEFSKETGRMKYHLERPDWVKSYEDKKADFFRACLNRDKG